MINANVICASPKQYQAKPQSNIPIPSLFRLRPRPNMFNCPMQKSARIFKCDRTANVSGNRDDGMVPFSQTRLGERIIRKKGGGVDRNPLWEQIEAYMIN